MFAASLQGFWRFGSAFTTLRWFGLAQMPATSLGH